MKTKKSPEDRRRPSPEDIETLAYLKYLDQGRVNGRHLDHWLEAEAQLSEGLDDEEPEKKR